MNIQQSHIRSRLNYDSVTGVFIWKNGRRKGHRAGCIFSNGYRYIHIFGRMIGTHRLAWLWVHGTLPNQVDHKNGIPGHDWIGNLRPANQSQNKQNSRVKITAISGLKGICYCRDHKKWRAQIGPRGSVRHLGYYQTAKEAHAAYALAATEMYGEFARVA